MHTISKSDSKELCESVLIEIKEGYEQKNILISEVKVIQEILISGDQLNDAYLDLSQSTDCQRKVINCFFDCLLYVAAFRNPKKAKSARDARNKLAQINEQISTLCNQLASLIDEKSDIQNYSGFSDNSCSDIIELMNDASKNNGHYQSFVREDLLALRKNFDLKYWPTFSDILNVLAEQTHLAEVYSTDKHTEISTRSSRPSKADFFDVLITHIEETKNDIHSKLPINFQIKDKSIASFGNVVLNLNPNNLVDSQYIKSRRHRL